MPRSILLIFLDGVGLGVDDPLHNPLAAAALPNLSSLARGKLVGNPSMTAVSSAGGSPDTPSMRAIDATLGVVGRPQSGTGQTALLTGANAPQLFGRHFGPWVPTSLREHLERENLLRRAADADYSVAFANCYPAGHMAVGGRGSRRPGAMPLAAAAAGVLTRDERSLRAGDAIVSSITTETWRRYVDPDAPIVSPEEAGTQLARIAAINDLTLFAHYDTDYVGHRGSMEQGVEVIERVDAFVGGVVAQLQSDTLLVITSDHGNLEDITTGHTRNPVPLIAAGTGARRLMDGAAQINDVPVILLELLSARSRGWDEPVDDEGTPTAT